MDEDEEAPDKLGWLETYELPPVAGSDWGAAPLLDEDWN